MRRRSSVACNHPNVVQVHEFGEDDGMLFLAMEYVEGPSLSRVLRTMRATGRKLPPAVVAYIAREICLALDYVHNLPDEAGGRLNVIHRDVTPSNILMTPQGGVKLLDFGVATFRDAAQITKAGTVKGKPAYLAPEQLEGGPIDGRVDLFALGHRDARDADAPAPLCRRQRSRHGEEDHGDEDPLPEQQAGRTSRPSWSGS